VVCEQVLPRHPGGNKPAGQSRGCAQEHRPVREGARSLKRAKRRGGVTAAEPSSGILWQKEGGNLGTPGFNKADQGAKRGKENFQGENPQKLWTVRGMGKSGDVSHNWNWGRIVAQEP